MDKHSKRSASIFRYPVLIAFTLFFAGLFLLDLVTPDRAYSELENTTLSQRPSLSSVSADGLNKFFTAYTKYVKDQVAGRDNWVALQSTVETKVMQKEQSGGILLGRQQMMFPRTYGLVSSETRTLPKNTAALEALCQRYPGKVNVMLVPAASAIYPENVPAGAPLLDEDRYLDSLSDVVQAAGGALWTCGRPSPTTKTNISTTAPTTTGQAPALTTPTSCSATPWALRPLIPRPTPY